MSWHLDLHEDGYIVSRQETSAQIYVYGDSNDEFEAFAALYAGLPYFLTNGQWLQDAQLGPVIGTLAGKAWWLADVKWGVQQGSNTAMDPAALPTLSFSTKGGRQHVTQSRETVGTFVQTPYVAPDFKGAIGVTKSGVQGTDIVVPAFSFQLTVRVPSTSVSTSYVMTCHSLTGCQNNATFFGFEAGEVTFLGMDGRKSGPESELSFAFSAEPNVEDQVIGDIDGIEKKGQDYLWVLYDEEEDTAAKRMAMRPKAAYVEQVKPPANFALLGLG